MLQRLLHILLAYFIFNFFQVLGCVQMRYYIFEGDEPFLAFLEQLESDRLPFHQMLTLRILTTENVVS